MTESTAEARDWPQSTLRCPRCRSGRIYRKRRGRLLGPLLNPVFERPFVCVDCDWIGPQPVAAPFNAFEAPSDPLPIDLAELEPPAPVPARRRKKKVGLEFPRSCPNCGFDLTQSDEDDDADSELLPPLDAALAEAGSHAAAGHHRPHASRYLLVSTRNGSAERRRVFWFGVVLITILSAFTASMIVSCYENARPVEQLTP